MRSLALVTPPASADDDAALLRRVAEGDHGAALGELYDRYGRRLYAFGVRLLGDRQLAEELVQETFLRSWRGAARFDAGRGSARGWLFTIARNVATDLHHRRTRDAPGGDVADLGALDGRLDDVLLEVTVREALDTLSAPHREVLELAYRQGLAQPEVARALDLPLGTVKSRTFHALRAMRGALQERGIDA